MLSKFFITHPIFATVISIVVVIAGAISQTALPVAKFPQITPPTVQVTAFYPGANAQVVAETVAAPVEQEVNGVENMIYMSSNSADDGSYTLNVTFEVGTDMDMATVLVQNRVSIAMAKLPEDVRRQGVTTKKQSTAILQFITLTSLDGSMDDLQLSNYATINIKDQLSRIKGVGSVTIFGADEYSMRVWLDPNKLKARNLTTEDVIAAITEQNVQVAAGRLGEQPAPAGTPYQLVVNTQGRLEYAEQFMELIVKTAGGGKLTRVKDVARVELGAKAYNKSSKSNGQLSTSIALYQLPEANAMDVAQQVREVMTELSTRFPEGLKYDIPFDTTLFVEASIDEVYETLFVAILLVVAVIYIFLQDWRATIVPCAAIPVSLIGTFAMMALFGFSINMLTLFGIVLAIGIVVDDAIVVVENSTTYVDQGIPSRDAAIRAMAEITGPVIATTLVLLAVFVPTAFMGGLTGQMYRQFALTISGAVLISTLNALTLSPALCGMLLRKAPAKRNIFFRGFNNVFDGVTGVYSFVIRGMVRRVAIVMIVFAGLLTFTGWSFTQIPSGFLPVEDQGYAFANIQLPDASSMERTKKVMDRVDEIMEKTPGVADWVSVSGYSLLSGTNGSNLGMVIIVFEPWDQRQSPELSQDAIVKNIRGEFAKIQDAFAICFVPPAIDGLGNASGFQMQLQDRGAAGLVELQKLADEIVADGGAQSGLTAMNTTMRSNVPQVFVDIDRTKVKTLDIPLSSVFNTMQAFLGSAYVNDYNRFGRTWQVRVQADQKFRVNADDIGRLEVRNRKGEMVPLGTFVSIRDVVGPQVVQRYNLYPSAQINGEPAAGYSSGQALQMMEQMASDKFPPSMGFEWTGMSYQEQLIAKPKSITQSSSFILLMSVVLVFLVLAAQYESWTSPAAVISVVPLAVLGVVVAALIGGSNIDMYTQIGIVLLIALASKNAILIVEFASELRREGKGIMESAADAARLRFRAILMTAFSSVLGFIPLLTASGAGAASRISVGTAVVGGMIAATVFSLLFVPSFFVLFQGLGEFFGANKPDIAKDAPAKPTSDA